MLGLMNTAGNWQDWSELPCPGSTRRHSIAHCYMHVGTYAVLMAVLGLVGCAPSHRWLRAAEEHDECNVRSLGFRCCKPPGPTMGILSPGGFLPLRLQLLEGHPGRMRHRSHVPSSGFTFSGSTVSLRQPSDRRLEQTRV